MWKVWVINIMENKVFVEKSAGGEVIAGIDDGSYKWYLNSRYSSDAVAEAWANQVEAVEGASILVVFGLANGDYVRKLADKYPDNIIMVYEPKGELTEKFAINIKNVIIYSTKKNLYKTIDVNTNTINYKYITYLVSPNYDKIYTLEVLEVQRELERTKQKEVFYDNTKVKFQYTNGRNLIRNLIDGISQNTIADLMEPFSKYSDRPAVLVSAGPSLDKNIEKLKKIKNKGFIMAVDSAVNPMVKAGILPDMIATIDPGKAVEKFQADSIKSIPLASDIFFNNRILEVHNSKRFYSFDPETYVGGMLENNKNNQLSTGGSVANTALSTLYRMGFRMVALVGQDLSYPKGKRYAEDTYIEGGNHITNQESRYFQVDGYNGGTVTTEHNMNMYRIWFENVIKENADLKIYNATEGGALIRGAENITLEEFADKNCTQLNQVDFVSELNSIPPHFTDEDREKKCRDILNIGEVNMPGLFDNIKQCQRLFEEFNKLNLAGKYTTGRFRAVGEKIIKLQKEIENTPEMELLVYYNVHSQLEAMDKILEKETTPYEENKAIYHKGIKLLESYKEAADMFMEDYREAVQSLL